jgi:hypothetical protein
MTKPTIAERGWLGIVIDDYLRPALKNAENIASDLENIELCDASGCGLMFDRRDKRAGIFRKGSQTYHFCPACEMTAQAASLNTGSSAP